MFNIQELERALRDIDPKLKHVIIGLHERQVAQGQQIEEMANLMLKFYEVLEQLQIVNTALRDGEVNKIVQRILKKESDDIVKSVQGDMPDD